MNGRPLCSGTVRFIAHGVNAARVDPAIVEVEERADGDGVVDCFVGEAGLVERCDVGRLNGKGIAVHFVHEAEESFLRLGEERSFEVREDAGHQFGAAEQFRRDRGVRLGSKRARVQVRGVGGNQLADAG